MIMTEKGLEVKKNIITQTTEWLIDGGDGQFVNFLAHPHAVTAITIQVKPKMFYCIKWQIYIDFKIKY